MGFVIGIIIFLILMYLAYYILPVIVILSPLIIFYLSLASGEHVMAYSLLFYTSLGIVFTIRSIRRDNKKLMMNKTG